MNLDEPKTKIWTHRELIEDLAASRMDCIRFAEVGIGSRWLQGGAIPIPDLLTLAKSYTKPAPTIFECKVSKSDFLADSNSGKWMRYLPYCCRFYFAVPEGLVTKKDIPDPAGLILRGPNGWHVSKAPKFREATGWDMMAVQSLLLAGALTQQKARDLRERVTFESNAKVAKSCKALGWQISEAISRLRAGESATAGGQVMKAVAELLNVSVLELSAMSEFDVKHRLASREDMEKAMEMISEGVQALRYGFREKPAKTKR